MGLNKKIIGFSIVLFLTINTGCAVESIKIEKRSFFDFKYMEENEKTILLESGIKIPEHQLNQWFPKQFTEKGKLSVRWKKEIDKEYCEGYYYASYPHAWGFKDCFLVDPYTGKSPETAKLNEKSVPFNDGITDGEYIFGFYNHKLSHSGCWRIKDQYMIWENLAALYDTQFNIIDHKLIHMMEYPATITRLNPWTGNIIWSFYSLDKEDRIISSIQNEKFFYIVLGDLKERFEIIRIDSDNGSIESILSSHTSIESIELINNNLWALFGNGQLCVIDDNSTEITKTYNVGIFNNISPIENKFLLSDDYGITHSMFDIATEEKIDLDVESAKVINNSLIFIDKEKIKGVDPETLETLWWIDIEENMKNASVEWLDWRGVLVETEDHVYCYALK